MSYLKLIGAFTLLLTFNNCSDANEGNGKDNTIEDIEVQKIEDTKTILERYPMTSWISYKSNSCGYTLLTPFELENSKSGNLASKFINDSLDVLTMCYEVSNISKQIAIDIRMGGDMQRLMESMVSPESSENLSIIRKNSDHCIKTKVSGIDCYYLLYTEEKGGQYVFAVYIDDLKVYTSVLHIYGENFAEGLAEDFVNGFELN